MLTLHIRLAWHVCLDLGVTGVLVSFLVAGPGLRYGNLRATPLHRNHLFVLNKWDLITQRNCQSVGVCLCICLLDAERFRIIGEYAADGMLLLFVAPTIINSNAFNIHFAMAWRMVGGVICKYFY